MSDYRVNLYPKRPKGGDMFLGYGGQATSYLSKNNNEYVLALVRIGINTAAIAVDILPTALDAESLLAFANFVGRLPVMARRIPGFGVVAQALMNSTPDVSTLIVALGNGQEIFTQLLPSSVIIRVPQIVKDVRRVWAGRQAKSRWVADSAPLVYQSLFVPAYSSNYDEI